MELVRLLEKKVKPKAERMDYCPKALWKGFKLLGRHRLLAQSLEKEGYFAYTELMQSYSGALGFFQRQHQAATRFIARSSKTALKEEWLPLMRKGKRSVGVSISHLRAPGAPCITAKPTEGGWLLTGRVPWVSGYRLFDRLLMGFFCEEEGLEGMGLIRFKKGRTFKVSKVLNTIALTSVRTLTVELRGHFLSENDVVLLEPIGTFGSNSDSLNIQFVNLSALSRGFLRDVEAPALQAAYETCRARFVEKGADVTLYAEMHRIATQLSFVARLTSGTRGILCPNPVERRCRELMLFSVILPTRNIAEACIKRLLA